MSQLSKRGFSRPGGRGIASILPVLLMLLFSGCAVGPDYRPPQMPVPAAWDGVKAVEAAGESVATPRPPDLAQWWKGFDDPVLTSLVERAVGSNLDLKQARARIRQARGTLGIAGADLWPTVDSSASYRRSGPGGGGSGSVSVDGTTISGSGGGDRDLFQAGLDASWELDVFGGARRGIEASEAELRAAVEDRGSILVSLVAEIGTNYFNLRELQRRIAIAEDNLKAQRHSAEIVRRRYEAGYVGGLDVANANAQVAAIESEIPLLASAARQAMYNLGVLLGREPTALVQELSAGDAGAGEAAEPPTPQEVPVGLPSDLLLRRPDIRRAEALAHAATARIGVATADLFPRFSLTGSFGFSSTDLASFLTWGSRGWSFGPSVIWPIFDAGRIRWNIEVQNAAQQEALLGYQETVLTALSEVEAALAAYAGELERRRRLAEAVVYNRRAVDLAMTLYTAGRTDFLNVLSAQRSLYASEDALARSTFALSTNLVALYKALGGGWENETRAGNFVETGRGNDVYPPVGKNVHSY